MTLISSRIQNFKCFLKIIDRINLLKFQRSKTIYIGNLSNLSTEKQIYEIFYHFCDIKKIIIGLDKVNQTPCGFCFIQFYNLSDMLSVIKYISGNKTTHDILQVDFDRGFFIGRQKSKSRIEIKSNYKFLSIIGNKILFF